MAVTLPPDAWDTHVHVFEPSSHPYSPERAYSPGTAKFSELSSFNSSLSAGKGTNLVLVQPSPYGTDNSLILESLRKSQSEATTRLLRAIFVLDFAVVTAQELREMHDVGVRGVRLNMESGGKRVVVGELKGLLLKVASKLKEAGLEEKWFVQLFVAGEMWDRELNLFKLSYHTCSNRR
jgi:predicted TIM-barrel fold metal-dependent hydrolase